MSARIAMTFHALCILAEAEDAAARASVKPSAALRLALAYLYAVGDRRQEWFDRQPYEDFWRAATQVPEGESYTETVGRRQRLTASLNGIARAAGVELTPTVLQHIRRGV